MNNWFSDETSAVRFGFFSLAFGLVSAAFLVKLALRPATLPPPEWGALGAAGVGVFMGVISLMGSPDETAKRLSYIGIGISIVSALVVGALKLHF
jgi:hypothetical protein